jgi:hypothetical protein
VLLRKTGRGVALCSATVFFVGTFLGGMFMNNKKIWIALGALIVVVALLVGVFFLTRPQAQRGSKHFTITVVHSDGTEKTFECYTDEEYLDKVLLAEGIITGHEDIYGLVIDSVDGEEAIWDRDHAFWALYIGDTQASVGISQVPVEDGASYKLNYEKF